MVRRCCSLIAQLQKPGQQQSKSYTNTILGMPAIGAAREEKRIMDSVIVLSLNHTYTRESWAREVRFGNFLKYEWEGSARRWGDTRNVMERTTWWCVFKDSCFSLHRRRIRNPHSWRHNSQKKVPPSLCKRPDIYLWCRKVGLSSGVAKEVHGDSSCTG